MSYQTENNTQGPSLELQKRKYTILIVVKAFWLGVGVHVGGAEQGPGHFWGLEDERR